jgi:hypothetical protein
MSPTSFSTHRALAGGIAGSLPHGSGRTAGDHGTGTPRSKSRGCRIPIGGCPRMYGGGIRLSRPDPVLSPLSPGLSYALPDT